MRHPLFLTLIAPLALGAASGGSVIGSKHDFSATGPEANRLGGAESACSFCHVSHRGAEGLSNRPDAPAPWRGYDAQTLSSRPGQPTGSSRACLSCHDGTVAIDATRVRGARPSGGSRIAPLDKANLGTDLRTSHPISIRPETGRRSRAPLAGEPAALDRDGRVQCTSCHDPHRSDGDPLLGKFLVAPTQRSVLCLSCHDASEYEAVESSHALSPAGLPSDAALPFRTVGEAGCLACHAVHGAIPNSRLTVRGAGGDDDSACLRCHGGSVAGASMSLSMAMPWSHSVRGTHDADEGPTGRHVRLPETSPGAARHAVCVDCHNPHAASSAAAPRPYAGGALAGVWGIDLAGQRVERVQYEYEVCFKCHADSANQPQSGGPTPPETVRRAVTDVNLRRVFAPSASSSHPVATPRRQLDLPGLKGAWASVPSITCSDCHSSSGGGARGPHGSVYSHLLELEYRTADLTPEGPQAYALCYKCHDRDTLLSETESGFPLHRKHVVERGTACAACHNAHGVSQQAGSPDGNSHLIDFDVTVVGRLSTRQRDFQDGGLHHGSCNLTCHGQVHDGVAKGSTGRTAGRY